LPPKNLASSTPEDQECRCKQAKKSSLWWQKRTWWYLKNPTNFQNKHTVDGRNPAPVQDFFHQQEYMSNWIISASGGAHETIKRIWNHPLELGAF